MSSIMTNPSAMTALKTLEQTNKALEQTQHRISTGYRVAEAADNAAYWSIATTMRSDNKALSTVQDALGLGSATVDVAYTAMNSTKDYLDEIKSKLVAAKQPGVDKSKIQSEITQLQDQIKGIATGANFSGNNWLSVNSDSTNYEKIQTIVSSFQRDSSGALSIGTIDVDITGISLFDSGTSAAGDQTGTGVLEKGNAVSSDGTILHGGMTDATNSSESAAATVTMNAFGTTALTLDDDDAISFQIAVNGGETKTITIDKAAVDAAISNADGEITNAADMQTVLTSVLGDAGFSIGSNASDDFAIAVTSSSITLTTNKAGATGDPASITIKHAGSGSNGNTFGIGDIDITNATSDDLDYYINGVDDMAESITSVAADLGSIKNRVDLQKDFVKDLMDAIDRGVGQLVDADMNEESTKLKALQTQQQLGIQSLSIANQNAQSILALFQQ